MELTNITQTVCAIFVTFTLKQVMTLCRDGNVDIISLLIIIMAVND